MPSKPVFCVYCGERLEPAARSSVTCTPCWWRNEGWKTRPHDRIKHQQQKPLGRNWPTGGL